MNNMDNAGGANSAGWDRRKFLQFVAAEAALCASDLNAMPFATQRPLNFVYIIIDDLGWVDIGPYGNRVVDTPNLDRLARESVRFTNAYGSGPVCSPSRASVLTGQYPARLHLTDYIPGLKPNPTAKLIPPAFEQHLPAAAPNLARELRSHGYKTASIGKWHLGGEGYLPTDMGFDLNIAGDARGEGPGFFGPEQIFNLELAPGESLTDRLTTEGVNYIEDNKDRPFFLYQAHYAVHIPIQARKAVADKYRKRNTGQMNPVYCAMVQSVDESVGRLLEAIDRAGITGHTVVFFTADHGGCRYNFKAPKPITTNAPLRAGKGHLFEGGIRIPLMIRWPGLERGITVDTPTCNVDVFSTICAARGIQVAHTDGVQMLPLLRNKSISGRPLFWHYPHYSPQGGYPAGAVRVGEWKLIEFFEDGRLELYNLTDDIGEKTNLVRKESERARRLHGMLKEWRISVDASMPTPNPGYNLATADRHFTGEEPPTVPA